MPTTTVRLGCGCVVDIQCTIRRVLGENVITDIFDDRGQIRTPCEKHTPVEQSSPKTIADSKTGILFEVTE